MIQKLMNVVTDLKGKIAEKGVTNSEDYNGPPRYTRDGEDNACASQEAGNGHFSNVINNLQPTNPITTQPRERQTRQEQTRVIPPRETPPRETPPRETPPREEPAQYLHDGYNDDNGDGDADVRANEQNNNPVGYRFVIESIEYYVERNSPGWEDYQKRYSIKDYAVYLGDGIFVKVSTWDLIQNSSHTVFLRELIVILWEPKILANRAVDISKFKSNIPGRSPIRAVESDLLRLLISLYCDFLDRLKGLTSTQNLKDILQTNEILTNKIRDCRQEERSRRRRELQM